MGRSESAKKRAGVSPVVKVDRETTNGDIKSQQAFRQPLKEGIMYFVDGKARSTLKRTSVHPVPNSSHSIHLFRRRRQLGYLDQMHGKVRVEDMSSSCIPSFIRTISSANGDV